MPTLISKESLLLALKYIGIGFLLIIGVILSIYLIEMFFNLGVYFGTFIRNVYNLVCSG